MLKSRSNCGRRAISIRATQPRLLRPLVRPIGRRCGDHWPLRAHRPEKSLLEGGGKPARRRWGRDDNTRHLAAEHASC